MDEEDDEGADEEDEDDDDEEEEEGVGKEYEEEDVGTDIKPPLDGSSIGRIEKSGTLFALFISISIGSA